MVAQFLAHQSLQFPIQVKVMTNEETKEYHRKKLYDLSVKSLGEVPQLKEPTKNQKRWVVRRMKAPYSTWERWYVGQYFTEEQKSSMGLTDEDVAGKYCRKGN